MTKLLFYEDTYLFESPAKLLQIIEVTPEQREQFRLTEQVTHALTFDQTIFYPQGGGQPSDQGKILLTESLSPCYEVESARFVNSEVYHFGHFQEAPFLIGQTIQLQINKERRILNAKLHSAGHAMDIILHQMGYNFPHSRSYHFPERPYVEYIGEIPLTNSEDKHEVLKSLSAKLEENLNSFIQKGGAVTKEEVPYEKLEEICGSCPDYLPKGKPSRIVTMVESPCPCGGTHVEDVSEIGPIHIKKISNKKGKIRVSYELGS